MISNIIMLDIESSWIGFWGSYFGSIISGLITLYVLFVTVQQTRYIQYENKMADQNRGITAVIINCNKRIR